MQADEFEMNLIKGKIRDFETRLMKDQNLHLNIFEKKIKDHEDKKNEAFDLSI